MKYLKKEDVKYIVVHCSDTTPDSGTTAKDIDHWHRQRGFQMIGYHYVVLPDGTTEHGRPLFYQGAHCLKSSMNAKSIGICYIGGREKLINGHRYCDTRTKAQKQAMLKIISELRRRYPGIQVIGHRDADPGKECPCFNAKAEYAIKIEN